MREVRIQKEAVKERVQTNRNQHRETFEKALEGYRTTVVDWFNEQVDKAKDGKDFEVMFTLPKPEDHTEDYDRVLDMVGLSEDETITLTASEFAQYMRDDWGWKKVFNQVSSSYIK